MQFIKVAQEELVVKPAKNVTLTTGGVSTCICFLASGYVGRTAYLAMYHWEGLGFGRDTPNAAFRAEIFVHQIINQLAEQIKQKMKPYESAWDELPFMTSLNLIGGERATEEISGTEFEVEVLQRHVSNACRTYFLVSPDKFSVVHTHFLTSGDDALRLFFSHNHIAWTKDCSFDSEAECDDETDEENTFVSMWSP